MPTSERLVTVSIGPLQGRVGVLETYLENIQALLTTLRLEARDFEDEAQAHFVQHLLHLSDGQFTYANEQLVILKALLVSADMTAAERGATA